MLPVPGGTQQVPPYDQTLFVNRKQEIDLVTQKAQALSLGQPVPHRTTVFWGYRGTGRTWLLRRLTELLCEVGGCYALYLDLNEWTPGLLAQTMAPEQAVAEITGRLADQLKTRLGRPDSPPQEQHNSEPQNQEFLTVLDDLLANDIFVLLLDHVYESDWGLLERLEEHCLSQMAVRPRVLLVMAGRGQAYHWKAPELRLYAEDHHPGPFDEDHTAEQLKRQQPAAEARAPQIYELSQGYPLGNYLLATQPTPAAALQEAVNGLLDGVSSPERDWLEAVCVLRAFDEERLCPLLAAYFDNPAILKWPDRQIGQIRARLVQLAMVRWNDEMGGWEVDKAIRPVLERCLQAIKKQVWIRLHCAAYHLYLSWEQEFIEEKLRWQAEAQYHAQCLRDAHYNPELCQEPAEGGLDE